MIIENMAPLKKWAVDEYFTVLSLLNLLNFSFSSQQKRLNSRRNERLGNGIFLVISAQA